MAYKRPAVRILCSVQAFWDQRISMQLDEPTEMDWRARELKEFADGNARRVPLHLSDVCKRLALPVSARQARRLFRNSVGMGFKEYAQKTRLVAAAGQLQATNAPIKEIALEAGYQSAQAFAKRFREMFIATPLEFRTLRRRKRATAGCVLAIPERRSRELSTQEAPHRAKRSEQCA